MIYGNIRCFIIPAGLHVTRKAIKQMLSDPIRGRTLDFADVFYKHVTPLGYCCIATYDVF